MDIKEYNVNTDSQKQNHPWEYARLEVVFDLLQQKVLTKEQISNGELNILDVGCGDAFFLDQLSKRIPNANYFAIDTAFDETSISFFAEKYPNIKFYPSVEHPDLAKVRIDIILLLDVIEHIENDIDFLKKLSEMPGFSNDTRIVITVPAYQTLFCSHDTWLGHYRRYTSKMLRFHLSKAGLKSDYDGYFFLSLLLARIIQKIKESIIKPDLTKVSGIGDWNGGPFISNFIKSVLVLDYKISKIKRIFGLRMPGLSTFTICRKQ
jgi:SAM-dependent methyltransferase